MKKTSHIPLTEYALKSSKRQGVFQILAKPTFSPIDFNLKSLVERRGWGASDRFRFWFVKEEQQVNTLLLKKLVNPEPHILLRKLDVEEDCFCHCEISMDGNVKIYSNDSQYAKDFFVDIFTGLPPSFHELKHWEVKHAWIRDQSSIAFFTGSLQGALGWTSGEIPLEIKESFEEALQAFEAKHYKSCIVMCRRTIEAIMKLAYERFFKEKPIKPNGQDYTLYEMIRKFQKEKTNILPRFTRQDAGGAIFNTQLFLYSYFTKIDKEIRKVYTLKINLNKSKEKDKPKQ
jgi:hypothetical protein